LWAALLLGLLAACAGALQAATPAGLVVTNTAVATYDEGTSTSNEASFVVAQVAGVELAPELSSGLGLAGDTRYYSFTLANTGNGQDGFDLTAVSEAGWPVSVWAAGEEGELAAETGAVPAGGQVVCYLAVTIPPGAVGADATTLTATSQFDPECAASAVVVTEAVGLLAEFSGSPLSGEPPLAVAFSDLSEGEHGVSGWSWDFGDGGTSGEQHPTHVYESPGTFTVSLTVSCAAGSATETKVGYVMVAEPAAAPEADFSASPRAGEAPLAVAFVALSTEPDSITGWSWEFGDGGTSSEPNPVYVYERPGTYTVSLTVEGPGGQATETKADYIVVGEAGSVVVDFAGEPRAGSVPLEVAFWDLTESTAPVTGWWWEFGDGGTSGEPEPVYVYARPGRYRVSLTVAAGSLWGSETKERYIAAEFTDVGPEQWAYEEIMDCASARLIAGYPDGSYRPAQVVNRDQLAVFVARAVAGGEENVPAGPAGPSFPDVPRDHWAFRYVEYARERGIVAGYPDGLYRPAGEVNRGQMAVFVARAMEAAAPEGEGAGEFEAPAEATFSDVRSDNGWSWCYEHVEYAAARGVVGGYDDGLYHPERTCSRDQIAVYMARAFGLR